MAKVRRCPKAQFVFAQDPGVPSIPGVPGPKARFPSPANFMPGVEVQSLSESRV